MPSVSDIYETLLEISKKLNFAKIFGFIWILCWFSAIWAYHLQLFISGLFCLFLSYFIFSKSEHEDSKAIPINFTMDKTKKTLTVQKIYEDGIKWEDNEICSGSANLPRGEIKEGDIIKNCSGNISFRHVPSNTLIGAFNFEN